MQAAHGRSLHNRPQSVEDVTIIAEEGALSLLVKATNRAPVRLNVAPPLIRSSVEEKVVPGDYEPSFEDWDIWHKLFKGKPGSVFVTPEHDEAGTYVLGGLFRSVLPETLVVRSLEGKVYERDVDYRYEPILGKIAGIDGRLGLPGKEKLQIACRYVTQRLDLVQAHADGRLTLKKGEARMVCPQLPPADNGAQAVAGVYVAPWKRNGAYVIAQQDIYPVRSEPPLIPYNRSFVCHARNRLEQGAELKVAFLGDSVTLGAEAGAWWESLWTEDNQSYVSRFVVGLRERYPTAAIRPLHAAQGGSTTEAANNLWEDVIAPTRPDLLIIAYGLNDAFSSIGGEPLVAPTRYKEILRALVRRAKEIEAEVILVSPMQPNPWLKCRMAQRIPQYGDMLRELADEESVAFADVYSEWMRQGASGIPPFSQLHNWINHPGPDAHAVYSNTLLGFFERGG